MSARAAKLDFLCRAAAERKLVSILLCSHEEYVCVLADCGTIKPCMSFFAGRKTMSGLQPRNKETQAHSSERSQE